MVGNFLSATVGTRFVCEELAQQLTENGWTVHTTSHQQNRLVRLADMISTTWRRRSQYSVAQVDVYSGAAFRWAEITCALLRRLGKPYILTLHGGNLPNFAKEATERVQKLLNSATAVTTPSNYLLEQMKPYRNDLQLIPNPLDLSAYSFKLQENPSPKFIWLRSFHSIYNPVLAIQVLAQVIKDFPDAHLTMVGPDKSDGSLQQVKNAIEAEGLMSHVTLQGRVEKTDVPKWLQRGDIFLNTTDVDNTPVSVMEAMACGLCVVSTNVGGLPYLLDDKQDALLVPPRDVEAMTQAITQILATPALARTLSHNAQMKARQFDWQVVMPQWEQLLHNVATGNQQ
ncbi:MAG: glycosyltransferase family 4 protein [Chloroflexota bacterium]